MSKSAFKKVLQIREVINEADEKDITIANTNVPDKLYGYGLQVRQML